MIDGSGSIGELMAVWTAGPMLSIAMTLAAFLAAQWIFGKIRRPLWMPPVLIAAVLLTAVVAASGIGFEKYQQGARWLTVLLGPATVALGVPLYQQMHHIRALWKPILVTLPIAATLAAGYALVIAWSMGASPMVMASLAPKSVTAPIAMGIAEQLGGSVPLTLGALLITGVLASLFVEWGTRWLRVKDERIIGFALGLNGHAVGTARAFEISPTAGAFSSLGMGLTGIFTALLLPLLLSFAR
ncbi:LrgA-associated membrane protein LrgB [Marinobacter nitratireducens]|uniref:LrgA-associated membrane protein LrgB n=1 Tax=Marinobacter nitratireducens TaxID=1137280 RepID=A0A072MZS8_9GAMM|nr:LrgB family protein [Marinobacter nitratireducens]KEF30183.1 LrgA-associated membrane protein LrgB [Marinobacter nitratireducens]